MLLCGYRLLGDQRGLFFQVGVGGSGGVEGPAITIYSCPCEQRGGAKLTDNPWNVSLAKRRDRSCKFRRRRTDLQGTQSESEVFGIWRMSFKIRLTKTREQRCLFGGFDLFILILFFPFIFFLYNFQIAPFGKTFKRSENALKRHDQSKNPLRNKSLLTERVFFIS